MAEVMVDGTWLHSLGHVSGVRWSSQWGTGPCGPALASCAVAVDQGNNASLLRQGLPLEVWHKGVKVFGGIVSEVGRGFPRTLEAKGYARRASDFDAVDGFGHPTTNPQTAVREAIGNDLPWGDYSAFDDVTLGADEQAASMRLDALLDKWTSLIGARWGVDANGVPFVLGDPSEPAWMLDASDLDLGVATDGMFNRVRARYVSSVDGITGEPDGWDTEVAVDDVGRALFGAIEYPMDLTPLGMIDAPTAADLAAKQLAWLSLPQWLSRVTTTRERLLTPGGLPADLPSVRAGQMVRLFNVPSTLGWLRAELGLDVILGEVEYDTENPSEVTLAPVGIAVRNIGDMARQAAEAAKAAGVSAGAAWSGDLA